MTMNACHEDAQAVAAPSEPKDVDVGSVTMLPPGTTMKVEAPDRDLALANVDGAIFALVGPCLRCGSPLAAGAVRHEVLTCLRCGWQYDVERGAVVGLPALRLQRHRVRVDAGRLLISADLFDTTPRAL